MRPVEAHFVKEGQSEIVIPKISQDTPANMVSTTRSRVSLFPPKFRKLGFINRNRQLQVYSSFLNIILHDSVFLLAR